MTNVGKSVPFTRPTTIRVLAKSRKSKSATISGDAIAFACFTMLHLSVRAVGAHGCRSRSCVLAGRPEFCPNRFDTDTMIATFDLWEMKAADGVSLMKTGDFHQNRA